jgi:hypothetical protein
MASEQTLPELAGLSITEDFGGQKLEFHPFEIEDFAAWDKWARADFLASCQSAGEGKDALDSRIFNAQLFEAAMRVSFGSRWALPQMASHAGRLRAVWLSLRRGRADLTQDGTWKLLGGPTPAGYAALNRAYHLVLQASGLLKSEVEHDLADPQMLTILANQTMMG